MSEPIRIELPGRFTVTTLGDLKTIVEPNLQASGCVILDGSAVTAVDSAALQFVLMVQHAVNSLQEQKADSLSVLASPSAVLSSALQDIGIVSHHADACVNEG